MNYINQIRIFWTKDIQHQFSDKEIAFYFYLLHTNNAIRWKNSFGISNKTVFTKFGWSRQTLSNIQKRLKEKQLIDYTKGLGRGNIYQYVLLSEKLRIEKEADSFSLRLELPYHSESFVALWNSLLQVPKWKEKPQNILQANLDRLKAYDEPFAIQLIKQTLLGNWQGLIFRDTDNQFKRWKAQQYKMNKKNRRDEIVRRAAQAAAACRI